MTEYRSTDAVVVAFCLSQFQAEQKPAPSAKKWLLPIVAPLWVGQVPMYRRQTTLISDRITLCIPSIQTSVYSPTGSSAFYCYSLLLQMLYRSPL